VTVQPPVDFVIVTPLEEERAAVLAQLPGFQQLPPTEDDVRVYYASELRATLSGGAMCTYSIIVVSPLKVGRVEAAAVTSDAIRRWSPRYVLLVGIAGGFSRGGVQLGDLLVSDQIVDYERQKLTEEGQQPRYEVPPVDPRLLTFVKNCSDKAWRAKIKIRRPGKGEPSRRIGPVASGDKVDAIGEIERRHGSSWPKLLGVEMEAGGAAAACFEAASKPGFLMIRGVSDLADAKKDSRGVRKWRQYACEVAAAYAIGLLRNGPVPKRDPFGPPEGPC